MAARTSERGTVVPVRDMEREKASSGSGPVKKYKMSPEEMEDYLARIGDRRPPRNQDGERISPPLQHNPMNKEAKKDMRTKEGPDKQAFLKMIAAGESIAAAEKKLGLKSNGMYYWLKKWDLIGITPGKARELLGMKEEGETLLRSTSQAAQVIEERATGVVSLNAQRELEKQLEAAKAETSKAWVEAEDLREKLKEARSHVASYDDELARWAQVDTEKDVKLNELQEDRDNWKQVAEQRKDEIDELDQFLRESKQAIRELEEERSVLLETIEKAAAPSIKVIRAEGASDNVNHPAHYTAGGVECIDAIEAAIVGLPGPQAYSAGAAIKYLWRFSRKNGVEDLQKSAWYLNRLIGEVGASR